MSTINIQYKGTNTCLDLSCPSCDGFTHYCVEMPFSGVVSCSKCKALWRLSPSIEIRPGIIEDRPYAAHGTP